MTSKKPRHRRPPFPTKGDVDKIGEDHVTPPVSREPAYRPERIDEWGSQIFDLRRGIFQFFGKKIDIDEERILKTIEWLTRDQDADEMVSFRIPPRYKFIMDRIVDTKLFTSRSEFIRAALYHYIMWFLAGETLLSGIEERIHERFREMGYDPQQILSEDG